jgi:hypothetical protein
MNNILIASLAAALAAPVPLLAHDDPVVVFRHEMLASAESDRHLHGDFTFNLRDSLGTMFASRMGPGKVVKGAPYSAEVVTETNQSLADGNVISHRKSGPVYRDGEGRTRQETGADARQRSIFINDPVAGTHYILSPGAKRAVVTAPRAMSYKYDVKEKDKQIVRIGPTEVRVEDGKVFIDGKQVHGSGRIEIDRSGKPLVIKADRYTGDGKTGVFSGDNITIDGKPLGEGPGNRHVIVKRDEEMKVTVIRVGDDKEILVPVPPVPPAPPAAPVPPLPGITTMRFESTARLGKGTTTSLGMKDFDGVKAEGKSTTWTIPAGEIGNRNPIMVMSETWYSPDLRVTVYSRHSDPRTGESVYRLASIRRGEPAPDLFKVPDDYKLRSRAPKG